MLNARFGRRTYVNAIEEDEGGGGGQEDGVNGTNNRQDMIKRARKQGAELQREAIKKKFFFQQNLVLEGRRKQLGKGNIVTFLVGDARQGIEHSLVNKILRIAGFEVGDIVTIKLNDFRVNQIEVLFAPGVNIDTQPIESKIRNAGVDVLVSKFEYSEEFFSNSQK